MALLDNAVRMRSTVFRGITDGYSAEKLSQQLAALDADGDRHMQALRDLVAKAGISVKVEPIGQNKHDYVTILDGMIRRSLRNRDASSAATERLADFDMKHENLRTLLVAALNRAEGQFNAGKDAAKAQAQTGTATVDQLGELVSNLLTEVYPILQGVGTLMQRVEQLDETAKLIVAQTDPGGLADAEKTIEGTFGTVDSVLAQLAGHLHAADDQAMVADIGRAAAELKAATLGPDGLLAKRRAALVANAEIANERAALASIERSYAGMLDEMEGAVRNLNVDARRHAEGTILQARTIVAASIVLTILLGLVFGYLLADRITSPLMRLTRHVVGIRQNGELSLLAPNETTERTDEIGALSRSFNLMIVELAEARKRLIAWSKEEINRQYERLNVAINNMPQGLCMFDRDQKLIICNRHYAEIYGLKPEQTTPGTPLSEILKQRVAVGGCPDNDEGYVEKRLQAVAERKPFYIVNELRDGHTIAVSQIPMANGGWLATHEDITERRKAEAQIAFLAHHDALTRLPNRVRFREEMDKALHRVARGEMLSILCLDLDHFKEVNDTLGHPVGDALLQAVSARIRQCVRPTDTIARLGGDEFALLQAGVDQPAAATALAARLIKEIREPFDIQGHQVIVGASIGIAVAPQDGQDPDSLLKNADLALYRAKEDGRGTYRFFESSMDAKMQLRRTLELDLRKALALKEFELFYQPLVNLQSGEISGCEALLRWHHPERGLVAPATFIPLAEEIGLIGLIGSWTLKQACSEAATWPSHIKIAVNLSPVQFKNGTVVLDVISALGASGLAANRLELEITETVLMQDTDATVETLNQLRELGVRISMDDFGTGYSSLGYLRKFPFDKIKIDQSFIHDLSDKPDSVAIVRAVTGLGSSLGMCTTAEGVETEEQLERLRSEGCTEVQGYLFSRPKPAAEIGLLLAGNGSGREEAA
jgi:diguanylate cyclase (GGDEF)-like protein/PAS domain S-box-containing protein